VNQRELCTEIFGDDIIYVPWQRPGFDIGLEIEQLIRRIRARGVLPAIIMSSWSNDDKTCYEAALEIIDRATRYIEDHDKGEQTFGGQKYPRLADSERRAFCAEVLPWLRGRISASRRQVATIQDDERMLRFVGSSDGPRLAALGTSCPDHFLRTKIKPLFVDWHLGDLESLKVSLATGLEEYRKDYKAYYERSKRPNSPGMRDPSPTVVLIPGLGMIARGRTRVNRVTAEFYNCAIE
jgi:rhamnose utilization protein RhaD (predicted bifunctional aldolase and dehydrogenase)